MLSLPAIILAKKLHINVRQFLNVVVDINNLVP